MTLVEDTAGTLLIGSWVNTALWAFEMALAYLYFKKWTSDFVVLQIAVVLVGVSDTLCTIASQIGVYDYTISHWGQDAYLATQHWPIPTYLISTAVTSLIVQTYLCHRYWQLSSNNFVSIVLALLTLVSFGGNIAVCVAVLRYTSYLDRNKIIPQVIVWFCTKAATDISICGALIWYLIQSKRRVISEDRRSLTVQITGHAIETGFVTSLASLAAFILFVRNNNTNASTAVGQSLGRLYGLCLLFNLLYRKLILVDDPFHQSSPSTTNKDDSRVVIHKNVHVSTLPAGAASYSVDLHKKGQPDDYLDDKRVPVIA
ncbi:hypothetical protein BT69DRAFT_1347955 [Atractiella rhizophila]|nr:hypothetical protein BT69DRAFT_1347955 [Atractiella rhizophila]